MLGWLADLNVAKCFGTSNGDGGQGGSTLLENAAQGIPNYFSQIFNLRYRGPKSGKKNFQMSLKNSSTQKYFLQGLRSLQKVQIYFILVRKGSK